MSTRQLFFKLVGVYQLLIALYCLAWLGIFSFVIIPKTPAGQTNWSNVCLALLIFIPTAVYAAGNALRILHPSFGRFVRWPHVPATSYLLTIMSSIVIANVMLQADWSGRQAAGGFQTSAGNSHLMIGEPAPDFSAVDLSGSPITLIEQQGNLVLLDFWATWCGPCLKGLPYIEAIHKKFGDRRLKVIGINLDRRGEDFHSYCETADFSYPQVFDEGRRIADDYGVQMLPSLFLIDETGKVMRKDFIFLDIEDVVEQYLYHGN